MVVSNSAGSQPVDLELANGTPASVASPLSNSYPRWAPFVQTYKGAPLFWITFSSTRDYGLRVQNAKTGMTQCYPPDVLETPGEAHGKAYGPSCKQPQLWAAITLPGGASALTDPSHAAFWLPDQDRTTHNHAAQWGK